MSPEDDRGNVRGQGLYPGSTPFNTFATLFNARRQIIVVVTLDNRKGRLLTDFRDDVRRSSITVNLKIGGNLADPVPGRTCRRTSASGARSARAYFTTPPTCPPSGAWTNTVTFSYRDGSSDQHSSTSPCN